MKALRWGLNHLGQHLRYGGAAYGVLLISLLLTALAYYYVSQNVEAQTRARFDDTTQAIQEAIERSPRCPDPRKEQRATCRSSCLRAAPP
jgi:hypothetical protein